MNLIWNRHTRSMMLRLVQHLPIRHGSVMCVCWGGEQWNCNPRAIIEYMMRDEGLGKLAASFKVCVAFQIPARFQSELPKGVDPVQIGSLRYFYLLATSHFIISNTRFGGGMWWPFPKRKSQIYIFTGHGANGIKKIEFDTNSLSKAYLEKSLEDTLRIDLFISCSAFRTRVIRSAYRYIGEILESGTPRNDSLYLNSPKRKINQPNDIYYLIYAPTFRNNGRRDVYGFDVKRVVEALQERFGGEWKIMVSSHPNMRSYYHEIYDFSDPNLIDVGGQDLQPLLIKADALITDYSSAEMDFSLLTGRPVFQLCRDRDDYDRGFYINPEDLPFPYATNDDELVQNILSFNADKYANDLETFNRDVIGLNETGHASESVVEWMLSKM